MILNPPQNVLKSGPETTSFTVRKVSDISNALMARRNGNFYFFDTASKSRILRSVNGNPAQTEPYLQRIAPPFINSDWDQSGFIYSKSLSVFVLISNNTFPTVRPIVTIINDLGESTFYRLITLPPELSSITSNYQFTGLAEMNGKLYTIVRLTIAPYTAYIGEITLPRNSLGYELVLTEIYGKNQTEIPIGIIPKCSFKNTLALLYSDTFTGTTATVTTWHIGSLNTNGVFEKNDKEVGVAGISFSGSGYDGMWTTTVKDNIFGVGLIRIY